MILMYINIFLIISVFLIYFMRWQVPGNSLAAKAGLVPTTRGFAGNIVLGDVIVGVDNKTVSYLLLHDYLIFYGLQIGDIVQSVAKGSHRKPQQLGK